MKRGVFFLVFTAILSIGFAQSNKKIPDELQKFVLKGYEPLDYATGDLNNDKKQDAVLILKIKGEDTLQTEDYINPKRPMLLLIRQENNVLKLIARNDVVVKCRECGGIYGDPYVGISVDTGLFSISFYGGSAWRWSYEYTFRYNSIKKEWFIYKEAQTSYWNGEPYKSFSSATVKEDELTVVSFSKYRPLNLDNIKEKKWKVKTSKANFYDVATGKSKPLTSYLIKGDIIGSYWETKSFIFVEYENKAGNNTRGFIKKTDVQKILIERDKKL
jgi:hypothetical protein